MKSQWLILAMLCTGGLSALGNEATMSIASISIRTSSATATDLLGATYRLEFTSDLSEELTPNSFNGDWYSMVGTVGYESFYQFENLEPGEVGTGFLALEIPNAGDANLNFFADFFEVDQSVQGSTSGALESGPDPVPVSALWNRAGGSAGGVVELTVPVEFGEILFDIPFEVFEYRGTRTYIPPADVGTPIDAHVDLARAGVPDQRFVGPFPLRLAQLELVNGNLALQVKAKAGARVMIESRPAVTGGNWSLMQSLALANDSESLALPAPSAGAGFWRVTSL